MKWLYAILILWTALMVWADNPPLPPWSPTAPQAESMGWFDEPSIAGAYSITYTNGVAVTNAVQTYPFLLAMGPDTNGNMILEAPPQWMLDGPPKEPQYVTIRLKFRSNLLTNELYTVDFTSPRDCAFVGYEIVEVKE